MTTHATSSAPTWDFAEELAAPLWVDHHWTPRSARPGEADLGKGWHLDLDLDLDLAERGFDHLKRRDDPLSTAWQDLNDFASAGSVPSDGPYPIVVGLDPALEPEEHRILVTTGDCRVTAGGVEGVRRAVHLLEELMRTAGGPYLPLGEQHRTPVITTRISRCFFGPINRPPHHRDELADDVDYYPEHYLNRLAHEGVNGLWLTVRLRDLAPTAWSGPVAVDPQRRLAKLRRTVAACARYGIRVFLFCIDPAAFGDGPEYLVPSAGLDDHPELGGHRSEAGWTAFCTNGEAGARYVRDTLCDIFTDVPGLGGLIDITLGERPTHCWSDVWSGRPINCSRCGPAGIGRSFQAHLTALRDGMRAGNPAAELISWLYVPYRPMTGPYADDTMDGLLAEVAAHTPEGVTVQVNMESTGTTEQLGREFEVLDYSLAWVGPSPAFDRVSQRAAEVGARMGAKLQVGCSHEVATVPFIPVPGNLYRKYRELHARDVSSVMQCWYFGNAPGPMTAAAGRLAFAPLPPTEEEFLAELAAPDWGADAPAVVAAWQQFRDAYGQFPATLPFSWFGPVHDSIMWPWHLTPVDRPIAPSWQLGWDPSGDRVGESFAPAFSFDEIVAMVDQIAQQWREGWERLQPLRSPYRHDRARSLDLGVAEALTLQWESAARTLDFHRLREQLPRMGVEGRVPVLDRIDALIAAEQYATLRLAELAADDSRLGFHSEAEGHKYHPEGLRERSDQLDVLRRDELPALRRDPDDQLWPWWIGPTGDDAAVELASSSGEASEQTLGDGRWSIWREGVELCLTARLPVRTDDPTAERLTVLLEATRLWPAVPFRVERDGPAHTDRRLLPIDRPWSAEITDNGSEWRVDLRWPIDIFKAPGMATEYGFRLNLVHSAGDDSVAWRERRPLPPRLCFDDTNSADLGWVMPPGNPNLVA